MSLDIRPDHLKIVEEILKKHLPDREVWAFGSRVNGTAKETSDLDLVVIGENPLDFQTLGALRDAFSESNIPYKVDVVDWTTISEAFREIIQRGKVTVKKTSLRDNTCMEEIQPFHNEKRWKTIELKEVCKIKSGKRPSIVMEEPSLNCSIPVIGGGGQSGFTNKALFSEPILITGRVGTLGKLFDQHGPCWPSDNALVIQKSGQTHLPFLRYALQMVISKAEGMNRGAANPLITQGDLGRLVIHYPPPVPNPQSYQGTGLQSPWAVPWVFLPFSPARDRSPRTRT